MTIPTPKECIELLKEYNGWATVMEHSKSVCRYACNLVNKLKSEGKEINKELVVAASLLHDIKKMKSEEHVYAGADFLQSLGYEEVAEVVRKHGLKDLHKNPPVTLEEKIVYYADKRDEFGKITSLEERFESLKERYGPWHKWDKYYAYCKKIEEELLG